MHKDCSWAHSFFHGYRLEAEVELIASSFHGNTFDLISIEMNYFKRSYGFNDLFVPHDSLLLNSGILSISNLQASFQASLGESPRLKDLVLLAPFFPDALLLYSLNCLEKLSDDHDGGELLLQRICLILLSYFPSRLDLLYALIAEKNANHLLKFLPDQFILDRFFYTNTHPSLFYLQSLWAKGHFNSLLHSYLNYQLCKRNFPLSDFVLRCYTIIGAIDRVDLLFRDIYRRHNAELQPVTLSNMIFTALGLEALDQTYIDQLIEQWRRLTRPPLNLTPQQVKRNSLVVKEKPSLVVLSADLRMHPVGRFWLPLVQQLATKFKLIHLGFNPHDQDPVRDQLKACSAEWHLLETTATADIEAILTKAKPDLLLDLGGHTADNRPGLLNQRFAAVQATYLGFYGPTYAEHCDWWILDPAIARRVQHSYPGSENIWQLDAPSLCYNPINHGLPAIDQIIYSEADHPIIGSFNHTRKLTSICIKRFGAILKGSPEAVLQFRSHSFFDPNVRRWFLQQFVDSGIAAHQLQPLPYAPSGKDALKDYGRIHLHLDSYPVSGTTTTLDSLAMGIPVLTSPNHLYAGAISAAILEQAGLEFMICEDPNQLPHKAKELCALYRSAGARRELAQHVRNTAICDTKKTPKAFAKQLLKMLKHQSNSSQTF